MSVNVVAWFEIYVDQIERAKVFYQTLFDVELIPLLGGDPEAPLQMWAFESQPEAFGAPGALVLAPGVSAGQTSVVVYFECADCAEQEDRAAKHGGSVVRPKMAIGEYGFISLVKDTEGNLIGLHSNV